MDCEPTDDLQPKLWNGLAGEAWVETQELLDQLFKPFEKLLVDAVSTRPGHVLDVGCGTGGTTVAIARALGSGGHCTGIDISAPMIAAAQARARREDLNADFLCDDAQTHAFDPASFDWIVSRFGVMFFNDSVQAFQNLRRSAASNGELCLLTWRSPEENPFMTTAERAAAPLLPNIPPRVPDAPGQFGLADRQRVHGILDASGWAGIEIQPVDVICTLQEKDLIRYFTRLGPLGLVLPEADEPTRIQVIETVRAAFDPYVHETEVRFDAACWMVRARVSSSS